jgi:short-subunit dehydrogenase
LLFGAFSCTRTACKAFVHNYTWSLRTQLAQEGVRVIGIYPQMIETDLHRAHADPNNNKTEKNPSAMSIDAFMADIVAGWDAGDDEVAAGIAKAPVAAYRAAFTAGTKSINESTSGVM